MDGEVCVLEIMEKKKKSFPIYVVFLVAASFAVVVRTYWLMNQPTEIPQTYWESALMVIGLK